MAMGTSVEYDSNVFGRTEDVQGDFGLHLAPSALLVGSEPRVEYLLGYTPSYDYFFEQSNASEPNHIALGSLTWQPGFHTAVSLRESFQSVRNLRHVTIQEETGPGLPPRFRDDDFLGERLLRNNVELELTRAFTPYWLGGVTLANEIFEPGEQDSQASQTYGGSLFASYGLDASNRIGGGSSLTYQHFDSQDGQPTSETTITQLFATWLSRLDSDTSLDLQVGPAFIHTWQAAFPLFGLGSSTDTRVTAFGRARLNRRWTEFLRSLLSYSRSQSAAAGASQSTIRDGVTFGTLWTPLSEWQFALQAEWVRQESATNQPGVRGFDETRWTVGTDAAYRLTAHTSLTSQLRYTTSDESDSNGTIEEYFAAVGFRYDFDPLRLWD